MYAAPIGIFDSGIGGLTVARSIHALLPHESTIYLGDTARVPYGPKSPDTVRRYSREILSWLVAQGVKAVVVACNTATAHALDELRRISPVPVLGVIEPGARAAARVSRGGAVGVIGTAGTIASGAYAKALLRERDSLQVVEKACPLLVPFVEEGWLTHAATRLVVEEYLAPLRARQVDTLVLGCTHYPLLKSLIANVMGSDVTLIDSAEETARELAATLKQLALMSPATGSPVQRWAATDDVDRFARVGAVFMGEVPAAVELVTLEAEHALT